MIQTKFLDELALRVVFPKQGFGSSNDGNTARRFFDQHTKSSEITGNHLKIHIIIIICKFYKFIYFNLEIIHLLYNNK